MKRKIPGFPAVLHSSPPKIVQDVSRARIFRPFEEPRNRFPPLRTGTIILYVVPARQETWASGIDSSESIPGLHKRLQIRAQIHFRPVAITFAIKKL
jgi:hypothetical protein